MSSYEVSPERLGPKIYHDTTPPGLIMESFDQTLQSRVLNPVIDPTATKMLQFLRRTWQHQGSTVILGSGVFDLMHQNHFASFIHARWIGTRYHYEKTAADATGIQWGELTNEQQSTYFTKVNVEGEIRLIESIDGNLSVTERKSNQDNRGNNRPILDWSTRATSVLSAAFAPDGKTPVSLVDAVTIHDVVDSRLAGTPHQNLIDLATYVQPDVWAVYCESHDTIEALQEREQNHALRNTTVGIMPAHKFYSDELLGNIKTSSIEQRIMGMLPGICGQANDSLQ